MIVFIFRQKTKSAISNEEIYNENTLKSIKNVQTAAELCGSNAVTAIKITAFVSPDVLQKLNQALEQQSANNLPLLQFASNTPTVDTIFYHYDKPTFL